MKKYGLISLLVILSVVTIFTVLIFINRLAMPFNVEGNYFDETESVVYHEQSVLIYGLIAFIFFLLTVLVGFFIVKK